MFKKILIALLLVVTAFIVVVSLQPADFRVTRSIVIDAAPAAVFDNVDDLHAWKAWSPWAKIDPAMKETFEGPARGRGAVYAWAGNKNVGEGRMTVTQSRPSDYVEINLEFIKPFAATNTTEFTFKNDAGRTNVAWSMYGKNNFMSKAVCLFMDMDKMVGADFEKGLAQMKALVESGAARN